MTGNEGKYIKLRVVGEDGSELHFAKRKITPMEKLMRGYSERKGFRYVKLRFLFDGHRISGEDTAEGLGLTENDTIEVYSEQGGKRLVNIKSNQQWNSFYVISEGVKWRFLRC